MARNRTILVVFKNNPYEKTDLYQKRYSFLTKEGLKEGDVIRSSDYSSSYMEVVAVLDEAYFYVNLQTGDLKKKITSTQDLPVKVLKLSEEAHQEIVYFDKVL